MRIKSLALSVKNDQSTQTIVKRSTARFLPQRILRTAACTGLLSIFTLIALHPHAVCSAQRVTTHSAPPVGMIEMTPASIIAVNNKAILPDGATIQFVGISDFKTLPGSKNYHWWKPDGSPLTNAPSSFQLLSKYQQEGLPGNNNKREQPNRDFVLDTKGFDLNQTNAQINFEPIRKQYASSGVTGRTLRPNSAWRYDNVTWFSDPSDIRGVKTLHLRLSRGAWRTYASTTRL